MFSVRGVQLATLGTSRALRCRAAEIRDLAAEDVMATLKGLTKALHATHGLGVAAPQLDMPVRAFAIRTPSDMERMMNKLQPEQGCMLVINPRVTGASSALEEHVEGCLSVPHLLAPVRRASEVEVEFVTERGVTVHMGLKGVAARVFQHELDHLDGVLFVDRVADRNSFMSTDEYLQKQQPHLHSHCESEASSPAADEPFARTDDDGAFLM